MTASSNPPAPQCRWITLTDGVRQFWCGARLIWSSHNSSHEGSLTMLSPSRHRRTRNTKSRIRRELLRVQSRLRRRNPAVHLGAAARTPAVALRPGALAPLSVNFPAAAAAAGSVGAAQPGPAAGMAQPAMQPFWPQMFVPWTYARRPRNTSMDISIESSPGGQIRAVVTDRFSGERLYVTRWYILAPQAQAAAQAWIDANL